MKAGRAEGGAGRGGFAPSGLAAIHPQDIYGQKMTGVREA